MIDPGGQVGIGTTAPAEKLTVQGNISASGLKLPDNSCINVGTGNDLKIYHDGANSYLDNNLGDLYIQNKADNKDIIFQADEGGTVAEIMRIDGSTGDVGIGTAGPSSKFHIQDVQNAESLVTLQNNRQDLGNVPIFGIQGRNSGTDVAKISFYRGSGGSSGYLTFATKYDNSASLTEKMRLDGAGNLGIGTTNPAATLHVAGSAYIANDTTIMGNLSVHGDLIYIDTSVTVTSAL